MLNGAHAVSRRTLLLGSGGAAAVAMLAAACSDSDSPTVISPDQAALNTALDGENALIVAFTAGVEGSTAEQRRGAAALRSHRAHADALIDAGAETATAAPSPPASARSARELARLQRAQADRLERLALGVSPRVALLLGSIAASDSATAVLLGAGR
jgi:hypothetical protein